MTRKPHSPPKRNKGATYAQLFLHMILLAGLGALFVYTLFYVYLPYVTRHGENVTVPSVKGMLIDDLDAYLKVRALAYKVRPDLEFVPNQAPMTVIKQYPLAGQWVKKGRKINVVLNARHPPKVPMPALVDGSVKHAQMLLRANKLQIGHITYVSDLAQNAVLEQHYENEPIASGTPVPQGAHIDLVVGDGLGKKRFAVPNLIGLQEQEARMIAIGSGLRLGPIYHDSHGFIEAIYLNSGDTLPMGEAQLAAGLIFKQNPAPYHQAQIGDPITLWVVGNDEAKEETDSQ